ncbi:MAG: DNA mismatch repair protein MutS, partial [Planctomycetes bacterium]|nr:DNA mismatch repair protein MutS [Planctomycetota bacterium]
MSDTPLSQPDPATVYADRLTARRATVAALSARLDALSTTRLAAFLGALLAAGLSFGAELFSPWFALAPLALFLYFVAKFEATRGARAWAERGARFYAGGLDRLAGKPGGTGDGARFADDSHPYATDLDLFGPGSLFERLSACRTRAGEDTLAAWLLAPAGPDEVRARQAAV